MNFGLSDDQASVLAEVERLVLGFSSTEPGEPAAASYSSGLDLALSESGFLDVARDDGFSVLDAALVSERVARSPHIVEAAASAIVAPALGLPQDARPVALVTSEPTNPARFLPQASTLLVDLDDHVLIVSVDPSRVATVDSLFAYPYGRLTSLEGLRTRIEGDVECLRRRWRIAIATEIAGCMAGALALVIEHVRSRRAFGRPLGAFQAIQHRLAMAAETVESCKWLAFRAAWSDRNADASIAAGFAQTRIAQFTYDLHQFTGAMGLTLEYPLHRWTYRLRALAGELGGASRQARAAATTTWPEPAS